MYTIRSFKPKTEDDYAALVAVHNLARPDEPSTTANWQFGDKHWPDDKLRQRFVVESGDQIVSEVSYMEPFWTNVPGKFFYGYSSLPGYEERDDLHRLIYEYVLEQLAERQPRFLGTYTREDRPFRVKWLESQEFVVKMREPVSELDLTTFDFSRFNGAQERVAEAGVKLTTLAQVKESDPKWVEKLYEMLWEIEQDVPSPDPHVQEPFDEFVKGFDNPSLWPEGWMMAIDPALGGDDPVGGYVGVSMLAKNLAMPKRINTWLTGVVRSHRRKGIALAMKLGAIEFAIQQGGTAIRTDNEENNPMLGINKALGFVEIPAGLEFEKEL